MSPLIKILLNAKYAKNVHSSIGMAILFFLVVACHAPVQGPPNDDDFKALLEKSKNYTTYPYHIDSALMILHELLPGQQGVRRGWVLNLMGVSYDIQGIYDSAAYYLYEASRVAECKRRFTANFGLYQFGYVAVCAEKCR